MQVRLERINFFYATASMWLRVLNTSRFPSIGLVLQLQINGNEIMNIIPNYCCNLSVAEVCSTVTPSRIRLVCCRLLRRNRIALRNIDKLLTNNSIPFSCYQFCWLEWLLGLNHFDCCRNSSSSSKMLNCLDNGLKSKCEIKNRMGLSPWESHAMPRVQTWKLQY